MGAKKQYRFHQYIFGAEYPYILNKNAALDEECYEFAKQIIELWDRFNFENINPTKDEMMKHLNEYLDLLLSKLDENSPLVNNVRIALRNETKDNLEKTDMYDHLLRIRAVFGI